MLRVGVRVGLFGKMYTERVGHRVRDGDDQNAAQNGGHGLRTGIETGYESERRYHARRRTEKQAGSRAVVVEESHGRSVREAYYRVGSRRRRLAS